MLAESENLVRPLHTALEKGQWTKVQEFVQSLPTSWRKGENAVMLDGIRCVADAMIEECSFRISFERACVARRALHEANVSDWIVAVLRNIHPASPVLRRLVMLVDMLATTEDGRTRIGNAKIVDLLVRLWRQSLNSTAIVATLATLCAGHIDNISRMMRNGGISLAMQVIENIVSPLNEVCREDNSDDYYTASPAERNEAQPQEKVRKIPRHEVDLLERTLLLLGLACICTPERKGEQACVVPALLTVIRNAITCRAHTVLQHALNAIGNIGDCWLKEGGGYDIPSQCDIADEVAKGWAACPRNPQVISAAAWALCGIMRMNPEHASSSKICALVNDCCHETASVHALRKLLNRQKRSSNFKGKRAGEQNNTSPTVAPTTTKQKRGDPPRGNKRAADTAERSGLAIEQPDSKRRRASSRCTEDGRPLSASPTRVTWTGNDEESLGGAPAMASVVASGEGASPVDHNNERGGKPQDSRPQRRSRRLPNSPASQTTSAAFP